MKSKLPHPAKLDQVLKQLGNKSKHATIKVDGHEIHLSNLDKALWPGHKSPITKRDYLIYLVNISPVLLPHLKDRPLTLIRFPNGINGPRFFQKHWDGSMPGFVETVKYYSSHAEEDQDYLLCNNLATLIWLAQIADLELHTVHARTDKQPDGRKLSKKFTGSLTNIEHSTLNYPDYIVFDLDPYLYSGKEKKGEEPELNKKGFERTCEIALSLKALLDKLGVDTFIKTSGRTGLHIYVPIIRNINYDEARGIAEALGKELMRMHPKSISMDWATKKRTGKVFFDHNMNVRGKTLSSIYSPRNTPDATISMPVEWKELAKIYPTDFTLAHAKDRLSKKGDLWSDILLHKTDLRQLLNDKL